jgi:hypothetical protein
MGGFVGYTLLGAHGLMGYTLLETHGFMGDVLSKRRTFQGRAFGGFLGLAFQLLRCMIFGEHACTAQPGKRRKAE